ncbi:MAG TPA: hypothetical protein VM490_13225 [Armatimonadaceae bacterium]|nr:hypothetical protein [Armatimonadaceae bacterium]
MKGNELPTPVIAAAIVLVVVVIGFVLYRATQPPAPAVQPAAAAAAARKGVDPNNPALPPVDSHANDWRPPGAAAAPK